MKAGVSENITRSVHQVLVMRRRVRQLSKIVSELLPEEVASLLDVGSGNGEIAQGLTRGRPNLSILGVDVFVREQTYFPVMEYDGRTLPFEDNAFDAVMLVDVLHHCDDPERVLAECVRVSKKWVLIKDHIADSHYDNLRLRFMDWVGNRSHGVALPYNYLSTEKWESLILRLNLQCEKRITKLNLYPWPFNWMFGDGLHFVSLLGKG